MREIKSPRCLCWALAHVVILGGCDDCRQNPPSGVDAGFRVGESAPSEEFLSAALCGMSQGQEKREGPRWLTEPIETSDSLVQSNKTLLDMSSDGRFVLYEAIAAREGNSQGVTGLYVFDRELHQTIEILDPERVTPTRLTTDIRIRGRRYATFALYGPGSKIGWTCYVYDMVERRAMPEQEFLAVKERDGGTPKCSSWSTSSDGRYVARTLGTEEETPDGSRAGNIVLLDRSTKTTVLVTASESGIPANGRSWGAAVSDDGRYVRFQTSSTNLGGLSRSGFEIRTGTQLYVRDMASSTMHHVPIGVGFAEDLDGRILFVASSPDGLYHRYAIGRMTLGAIGLWSIFTFDLAKNRTYRRDARGPVPATDAEVIVGRSEDGSIVVLRSTSRPLDGGVQRAVLVAHNAISGSSIDLSSKLDGEWDLGAWLGIPSCGGRVIAFDARKSRSSHGGITHSLFVGHWLTE